MKQCFLLFQCLLKLNRVVFHQLNIFHIIFILYVEKHRWHHLFLIVCHFKAMNRLLERQTWKETAVHNAARKIRLRSIKGKPPWNTSKLLKNTQPWEIQLQNMLLPQSNTCKLQTMYLIATTHLQKNSGEEVYASKWAGTEIQAPTITGGQPFQCLTIPLLPQESVFLLWNVLFFTYSHTSLQG